MKILLPGGGCCACGGHSFAEQSLPPDLRETALAIFKPLPSILAVTNNPSTPEKVALGKALYFDPRLSSPGVFSCTSCHNLATGATTIVKLRLAMVGRRGSATRRRCLTLSSTNHIFGTVAPKT